MPVHAAPVTPSTIVVAVDVGKTTAAISATDTARHRLFGPVDITMTRSDLTALVIRLTDCFPRSAQVKISIEAASHYHHPMLDYPSWPPEWEVLELNPARVSEQRRIQGRRRIKTDAIDLEAISHETIYRSIYTTRWDVIPQKLCKRLRTRRPIRKNKRHSVKGQWRSQIIDARPIEDRPASAEDRSVTGHMEGDLVIGSKNSQVATLVDRKARYLTIVQTPTRHTTSVVPALVREYARMDPALCRSLTWDRGMELADHKLLSAATGIEMFFAAPRSTYIAAGQETSPSVSSTRITNGIVTLT
ncbi:IS30 family transposase [Rhodococcus sp. IEGM 1379]|uniref:IS30 family transposase n=1 Tax=Rhodococcus sp. IEGM 1379 TaxID=3047086 RepID=UPI0024B7C94D|nr:IS30 family transposase [Rhodococcus sp. IEGM 1379]MDI9916807.1 IS30 family transposase [Rhodococcus sp. IEGM 1379]